MENQINLIFNFASLWKAISLGLLVLLFLLSHGPPLPHFLELASHFYLQLSFLLLIPLIALAWERSWLSLGFVLLAWHGLIHPLVTGSIPSAPPVSGKGIKILFGNLLYSNHNTHALADWIQQEKPDLIIIQELNAGHLALMQSLNTIYPYEFYLQRPDPFGLGVWSRLPLHNPQKLNLGQAQLPSLGMTVAAPLGSVYLLTSHPFPPVSVEAFQARNHQFEALAAHLQKISGPKMLIGDLNTTPWSGHYRKLRQATQLHNARQGFGILPTWPTHWHPLLRIPIDHILFSSGLAVNQFRLGPDLGSDHLPLVVELAQATSIHTTQ